MEAFKITLNIILKKVHNEIETREIECEMTDLLVTALSSFSSSREFVYLMN